MTRGVLAQYGREPARLAAVWILLPNRRSCRALREAFLAAAGGKPLLLPRIQPIGEAEEEAGLYAQGAHAAIPPAIPEARRQFLLTRLVMAFKREQSGGRPYGADQAAELAKQLARFIDDAARSGLSLDGLRTLVPDDLAKHWQQTLDFLAIISSRWPGVLAAEGAIDPVERRNRLLLATAESWRERPPAFPVIAAGSTGSLPATAALLSVIARLQQGKVVLPGLDTGMADGEWDGVAETHPQFGLKRLLETIGCGRGDVGMWGYGEVERSRDGNTSSSHIPPSPHPHIPPSPHPHISTSLHLHLPTSPPRLTCLRAVLQSPEATPGWARASLPLAEGLEGMRLVCADTPLDEARIIAVALRRAAETPGRTAALVTPDRTLARMVAAQMQRFGIAIDDSAGRALADTPAACFLRLLIEMAAADAAPSPLLALLRHPLAAAGMAPAECRLRSRTLETALLRGLRRAPGLEALRDAAVSEPVRALLASLGELLRPLTACFLERSVSLRRIMEAHLAGAQWLASTDRQPGSERLWDKESGNRLAEVLADYLAHAGLLEDIDPRSYAGLLNVLLAGHSYHPRHGLHPRLHILSPMEARLQQFDLVILGGLNEGVWPQPPPTDPWMSRPMRAAFGLPAAERAIGQGAHDFTLLGAAPEVLLTRARKAEGSPTVASRWLVRLETLVGGLDAKAYAAMHDTSYYERSLRHLDAPQNLPSLQRPRISPPPAARPRQLPVTAIDGWLRDPYALYARHVLRLRPLPDLDREPDAADFGMLLHGAMERFTARWPESLPDDAVAALLDCGEESFASMAAYPAVACLWRPRFAAMAEWLIEQERARRGGGITVLGERKGRWDFAVDGQPFTLTTRVDRLEIAPGGAVSLADYKTGAAPSPADIEQSLDTQLSLEALTVLHGRMEPPIPPPAGIARLEYWKLAGRREHWQVSDIGAGGMEAARAKLEGLIRRFSAPDAVYAPPLYAMAQSERRNPYRHLTRRQEWGEG